MRILAIDPGPTESAFVLWNGEVLINCGLLKNADMRSSLRNLEVEESDECAIETITSYGMAVGKEVFDTCIWIGVFLECWDRRSAQKTVLIPRSEIKLHHCHSAKAKDANIRQALIDKYGKPGTKKQRGLTYGLNGHLWSAFAIATYVAETTHTADSPRMSTRKKEVTV